MESLSQIKGSEIVLVEVILIYIMIYVCVIFRYSELQLHSHFPPQPHTRTHAQRTRPAIILQMQALGVKQFGNLVHEGIVDLSATTVQFCLMAIDYMNDVFKIYTPELMVDFVTCFCDIFRNMGMLYNDALRRDENIAETEYILNDSEFVIKTLLPTFIERMKGEIGVDIPDLVDLHDV